jgi:hypothetical protein
MKIGNYGTRQQNGSNQKNHVATDSAGSLEQIIYSGHQPVSAQRNKYYKKAA